jgi:hypothetical protein
MTKIYAVSSGTYSDYSIRALFSTRELAELFIARHPLRYESWNEIEEYSLDSGVAQLRAGSSFYHVQMDDNGDCEGGAEISTYNFDAVPDSELRPYPPHRKIPKRFFNWYGWALTPEHAVKCANEHRIALLARL